MWVKSPVTRRGSCSYQRPIVPSPPIAAKVSKKAQPFSRAIFRWAATRRRIDGSVPMLPSSSRVPRSIGAMTRIDAPGSALRTRPIATAYSRS